MQSPAQPVQKILNSIAALALSMSPVASFAHEGHGLFGSHWHATDVWGFVALAGIVGAALWFGRGKK